MMGQDATFQNIFKPLPQKHIEGIRQYFNQRQFSKDEIIFKQHQTAENLFILLQGAVEIRYKPYDAPPLVVAQISPGEVFGWSAAMGRDFYTSGAVAILECNTCCVSHKNLRKMCKHNPIIGDILVDKLAGLIAARLFSTHSQVLSILRDRNGLQKTRER
jgi:CRP/FNR family cyclic AMP-dependent transcriptional regulator